MGDLPELMEIERDGQTLIGYPALVDAENLGRAAGVRLAGEGARIASRWRAEGSSPSLIASASVTCRRLSPRT
jgi:hypothetical protein